MKYSIYVTFIAFMIGLVSCSKSSDAADDSATPSHVGHWVAQNLNVSGGRAEYITYETPFEMTLNSNGICHINSGNFEYEDRTSYMLCDYDMDGTYSFANNKLTLYVDKETYTFTFTEYTNSRLVLKSTNFPFSISGYTFEFAMIKK